MTDLKKALPHLIMATVVIAAVVILVISGDVTGGEGLPVIVAAGGFTLGGTVASASISTAAGAAADVSHSISVPPAGSTTVTTQTTSQTPAGSTET